MKTAISLPDKLFKEAEREAKRRGVTRSKLVQTALEALLQAERDQVITDAINKSIEKHGDPSEGLEPWLKIGLKTAFENTEWDE
jgi:hypothetical protein